MAIDKSPGERRKYLRLDTVFPVSFRLESHDGKIFFSNWLQGFTNNLSRGGICLSVNNLEADKLGLLEDQKVRVSLEIEPPFIKHAVAAQAHVTWIYNVQDEPGRCLIGLQYVQINRRQNNKIMRYAWARKLFIPVSLATVILLGGLIAFGSYTHEQLINKNRELVERLMFVMQEYSRTQNNLLETAKEKNEVDNRMITVEDRLRMAENEKAALSERERLETKEKEQIEREKDFRRITELDTLAKQLNREKLSLQTQLEALKNKEKSFTEASSILAKEGSVLQKANFDKMYTWLKVHQNPHTGLVMSFEGAGDLSGWAFTYDQSLAAQAYMLFGDITHAKKILNFYAHQAKKDGGLVYNAYYTSDGEPAEYTVHTGPNIWLGIAIAQYTNKTKDKSYLGIAEDIAKNMLALQDREGGLRGGPGASWYSTEHNLDAYAFFNILYKLTGKENYLYARNRVLNWLLQHTYGRVDLPVKRGKGDSTIATDTYAWSIAAIGPQKLQNIGMDPDKIMEFAEQNCAVDVSYERPDARTVNVKGFDFAPKRNLARGAILSSEWTAQMITSFKIMSDFYASRHNKQKAAKYALKADEYLSNLSSMIISSPSPSGQGASCMPYATEEFVDTGHGWMTPKGKSTGSVAGTAYTLFAYHGYNPLELKD